MKDCISCGEGEHRLCASCNRDMRRELACPVCMAPITRRTEGRRVLYEHPRTAELCLVAEASPWHYTATGRTYLVVAP